jgi:Mg-chelatase subunit ChlI
MDIIDRLNNIMELEMEYRDNIPEAFSQRYDDADNACNQLEEAIFRLEEAF